MATRQPTIVERANSAGGADWIVTWAGLLNGDDGAWFAAPGAIMRAISASGTFGAAGSVSAKATNGNAMQMRNTDVMISGTQPDEGVLGVAFTAAGIQTANMYVAAASYRPQVTAGDGTTSLTFTMYFVQD